MIKMLLTTALFLTGSLFAQTNALAVQPFVQLVGDGLMGVGWQAETPSFGTLYWKQDQPAWHSSFYAQDGLKEYGGIQRAAIQGYDPTKALDCYVESKETKKNGGTAKSAVVRIPPIVSEKGETSFLVITDIHGQGRRHRHPKKDIQLISM